MLVFFYVLAIGLQYKETRKMGAQDDLMYKDHMCQVWKLKFSSSGSIHWKKASSKKLFIYYYLHTYNMTFLHSPTLDTHKIIIRKW